MKYVRRRGPKKTGGLRKRWYLNAGATLPFVGRTTLSMGNSKAKRSIVNMVRNRLEEPLHKLWSGQGIAQPTTQLLANTIYTLNLAGNIPQGTSDANRSGDTIHLDALKFKVCFSNITATTKANPKFYRLMIVKHDAEVLQASNAFGSGLTAQDLFHGNNFPACEQTNAKQVTVLYDKMVKLTPQGAFNDMLCVQDIVRFGSTFVYKTGTNYGKASNYYLVVTSGEIGASTGTTNLGTAEFYGDLIFKDSK